MIISQGTLCTYECSVFKINVYCLERIFLYFSALYFSWIFACGSRSMASFGRNIGKYNAVRSGDINEQLLWCSWVLHTFWHYLL